ncbi:hypothetical protein HUU05_01895 [candidate division KSB1 bacterium]|nr:hypothetical protein [candidate division KSB1 bacterium]
MWNNVKQFFALMCLLFLMPKDGKAQEVRQFPYLTLGINGGYFQPNGDWTAHRYAQGLDLFQGGATVHGEFELVYARVGIALRAGYANLSTTEWEEYASARGDEIQASASLFHVGVLLKPYLKTSEPDVIKLELGVLYALANGEEQFDNTRFEYDFFNSGFGFTGGVGYEHYFSRTTALTAQAITVLVLNGVRYADGEQHTLRGLSLVLGIRYKLP